MKHFLLGSALALGAIGLQAQDCDKFFPNKEGAKMEFAHYDGKDKLQSNSVQTITSTHQDGSTHYWTTHFQSLKPNGKVDAESDYEMSCNGNGDFTMDMRRMLSAQQQGMEGMDMSIEGGDMVFPGNLSVGQTLPDGHLSMKASMNGMTLMSTTIDVTDRKIVAKESITTPAGTFECFKLEENVKFSGIVTMTGKNVSWFAAGAGLVKSLSYDGKGNLSSRTELTKLNK